MSTFANWLTDELENRNMSQADLHRASGLSRTAISQVISDTRKPGSEFCLSIARALNLPPEYVFRKAELLPPQDEINQDIEETVYLLKMLEPDDLEEIKQIARLKLDLKKSSTAKKKSQDTLARNR